MASTTPSRNFYVSEQLVANLRALPLWVKQVVFVQLYKELTRHFVPESLMQLETEDTIAFFIPRITSEGERFLLEVKGEMNQFLMASQQKLTLLDMCLYNSWSLETCCNFLNEAIKCHWVQPPVSTKALGTIEFLANRIRLGEYLVKMDRISPEQLEQALRTQQYIKEALHEHSGIANILINLGYITRQDTEGLLFLKEESGKAISHIPLFERLSG